MLWRYERNHSLRLVCGFRNAYLLRLGRPQPLVRPRLRRRLRARISVRFPARRVALWVGRGRVVNRSLAPFLAKKQVKEVSDREAGMVNILCARSWSVSGECAQLANIVFEGR
jgi:hypothetical protein